MCGILAIINKKRSVTTHHLERGCSIIRHRGPDDEGFLTWQPGELPIVMAGDDTAEITKKYWKYESLRPDAAFKVGLGHRRLSILDLSPAGHQPMVYEQAGLAVIFNGEIYNYLELKKELGELGHEFRSTTDTEVILHAWEEWGPDCVHDFNGMFAFIVLDYNKNELYAVRDRFGVKPLYYYHGSNATYFASEIKQIRTSPDYQFELNGHTTRQYLASGVSEFTDDTFDRNVKQVKPGYYIRMDISGEALATQDEQWYTLTPHKWHGSFDEAADKFKHLLQDAVNLRLRSDVKVGSCLSGGLDSSSIVCIAADLLKQKGDFIGQETVTASFRDDKYDEWKFAEEVIKRTNAHPHKVYPEFRQLQEELDKLLWHQDEPFSSTSIFSQWMVFKKTHEAGLKVMIDGQGADEQLAGYGGNDLALYAGLLGKMKLGELYHEARHYKDEKGKWPKGFLLGAMQVNNKWLAGMLPNKYKVKATATVGWLQNEEPVGIYSTHPRNLHENLRRQVYGAPLPALLRFEDHNSMAWSVESRTPFLDYRLLEFTFGLPEQFIYSAGVRKRILRKAMHGIIPEAIENRKDKMGFVTPEELWLKGEGREWFLEYVDKACGELGHILNEQKVKQYVNEMIAGRREFDSMPWRIVCFYKWFTSY